MSSTCINNPEYCAFASSSSQQPLNVSLSSRSRRVKLFNSILAEIMFKKRLEEMDVAEMLGKMNAQVAPAKPFTLLEIKPFLQDLDSNGRIFLVEDEGTMGTVYAVA